MIRTLSSPGVELFEVDKSQYTVNAMSRQRVLLPGFSSKGPNKQPTTITSLVNFATEFGYPSNEAERYAYNATDIILNHGAEVVFARLPYADGSYYPYIEYEVEQTDVNDATGEFDAMYNAVIAEDDSLASNGITGNTTYATISAAGSNVTSALDDIRTEMEENTFRIVDITNEAYRQNNVTDAGVYNLGILPVITTAANAMAAAKQLSLLDSVSATVADTNAFESLTSAVTYITATPSVEDYEFATAEINTAGWETQPNTLSSNTTPVTISNTAARLLPAPTYTYDAAIQDTRFDRSTLNKIGIVVFKLIPYGNTIRAEAVEAYTGTLNAADADSIATKINNASRYINLFTNVQTDTLVYNTTDTLFLYAQPSNAVVLGTPQNMLKKQISYSNITTGLADIFENQSNVLNTTLDIVCDAGLSTIAQFIGHNAVDATAASFDINAYPTTSDNISTANGFKTTIGQWRAIVEQCKAFCQTTRKDCVYITETPRHFSLIGDNKRVDPRDATKAVNKVILPLVSKIAGINTSYGWGYAQWYQIADAYSGKLFWMPSSAHGAGIYARTRTVYNMWDAPAGMTRGPISVNDISFETDLPTRNELYANAWNYASTYVNAGVILDGQKTFQVRSSAFDRINVRSLFLYLERKVFTVARNYMYEPNTAYTHQQFVDEIKPTFDATKAAGGIYDYKIVAGESINAPDILDNNEFRVRIGIKPTKTIEWIFIEFTSLRTGASFEELI